MTRFEVQIQFRVPKYLHKALQHSTQNYSQALVQFMELFSCSRYVTMNALTNQTTTLLF